MPLIENGNIYAYSGKTLAHSKGAEVTITQSGKTSILLQIEGPVQWLKVSPNGRSVLIYTDNGSRIWRWREGRDKELLVRSINNRDIIGCGFLKNTNGEIVTLISSEGKLKGINDNDEDVFEANLRSPHSFLPRSFVQLPGNRIAFAGAFFSDPSDAVITIPIPLLTNDTMAVQAAIKRKEPLWDRAIDLAVGPSNPFSGVVIRDPEDTEQDLDEEDLEEMGGVGQLTGVYIRNLDTGVLEYRTTYKGRAGSGAPIAASNESVFIQVPGGVEIISRIEAEVTFMKSTVLDVAGSQLVRLEENNKISIISFNEAV